MTIRISMISESHYILFRKQPGHTIIFISFIHQDSRIIWVQKVGSTDRCLYTSFQTHIDLWFPFFSSSCFHNQYSIGTFDTINSSCRSIFQDWNTFNFVYIDLRQLFVCILYVIYNNQRFIAIGIQRTYTTNKKIRSILTWLPGGLLTKETGQLSCQSIL